MSNRRTTRPPSRRDAAVDALIAGAQCGSCGSTKVLRRWRSGEWELVPLHRESCATRAVNGRSASPHQVSETSVEAAREAGFAVAYMPYDDGSGGVVVDGGDTCHNLGGLAGLVSPRGLAVHLGTGCSCAGRGLNSASRLRHGGRWQLWRQSVANRS